jgi:hypothetical protein
VERKGLTCRFGSASFLPPLWGCVSFWCCVFVAPLKILMCWIVCAYRKWAFLVCIHTWLCGGKIKSYIFSMSRCTHPIAFILPSLKMCEGHELSPNFSFSSFEKQTGVYSITFFRTLWTPWPEGIRLRPCWHCPSHVGSSGARVRYSNCWRM